MVSCAIDPSLKRKEVDGFKFPLGVYPIEPMLPVQGYTLHFEPADSDQGPEEWEAWPDRYVFDVVISAERVESLCRLLMSMLPSRVFPIVDFLGHDAYREVDPYMAYELVPIDLFTDGVRRFHDFFFEDGMCGFGAMCEEPFVYMFVDEHKIVTVRADPAMKDRIEKALKAFGLEEVADAAGADASSHEHRSVLITPPERNDLLGAEEIVERLRERWNLVLNIDPETNVDEDGKPLGITPWRIVVRVDSPKPDAGDTPQRPEKAGSTAREAAQTSQSSGTKLPEIMQRYAQVLLYADSLRAAEEAAQTQIENLLEAAANVDSGLGREAAASGKGKGQKRSSRDEPPPVEERDVMVVAAIRLDQEEFETLVGKRKGKSGVRSSGTVMKAEWLDESKPTER